MDSVDRVFVVLPLLAFFDGASTLYLQGLRLSAPQYAHGFFAIFYNGGNNLVAYASLFVYTAIFVVLAYLFLQVKEKLDSARTPDKAVFLALVCITCYCYLRLTVGFIVGFFMPAIVDRGLDLYWITAVIYGSTIFSLGYYIWHDLLSWVKADGNS